MISEAHIGSAVSHRSRYQFAHICDVQRVGGQLKVTIQYSDGHRSSMSEETFSQRYRMSGKTDVKGGRWVERTPSSAGDHFASVGQMARNTTLEEW